MMVIIRSLCCRVSDPLKSNIFVIVRGSDYRGDGGGNVLPTFWLGDAKVNVPPLIAHLVKFLGHIYHLDKLDYCISGVTGVSMHCFPHI